MSATWMTFLYEAANFLVFAALMGWLLFQPVRRALGDRRQRLEREASEADARLSEADKVRQEIAAAHAHLQEELKQLRADAVEQAQRKAAEIVSDARAAAARELERGRLQVVRISDSQRDRLAQLTATVAAKSVGRLLDQMDGPDLHASLVHAACRELQALGPNHWGSVKVESSRPLSDEQFAALSAALGPAATTADFRTVDDLGAGVRIATGHGLVDTSTRGLTAFARQILLQEMNHQAGAEASSQATDHEA